MTDDRASAASCATSWSRAMQRVPELAGRELTLTALSGGITNRNFLVAVAGRRGALRHPAGRQRHAPARHQPRGRARGDRRGRRRRRRAGGHRLHPARGLPRDPVHRGLAGHDGAGPRAGDARACRRRRSAGSTTGRRSPACSCRSGSSRHTGRWPPHAASAIPPEYELAAAIGRRIELACLADPDRAAPVPQRPAQRELHRRRSADPDRRLGIRRHGRPVLRPRQLQHQPRADARRRRRAACRVRTARSPPAVWRGSRSCASCPTSARRCGACSSRGSARSTSTSSAYAAEHFDRLLSNATTPAFERALREAAGD